MTAPLKNQTTENTILSSLTPQLRVLGHSFAIRDSDVSLADNLEENTGSNLRGAASTTSTPSSAPSILSIHEGSIRYSELPKISELTSLEDLEGSTSFSLHSTISSRNPTGTANTISTSSSSSSTHTESIRFTELQRISELTTSGDLERPTGLSLYTSFSPNPRGTFSTTSTGHNPNVDVNNRNDSFKAQSDRIGSHGSSTISSLGKSLESGGESSSGQPGNDIGHNIAIPKIDHDVLDSHSLLGIQNVKEDEEDSEHDEDDMALFSNCLPCFCESAKRIKKKVAKETDRNMESAYMIGVSVCVDDSNLQVTTEHNDRSVGNISSVAGL